MPTISEALATAADHYQSGRLLEAEHVYRQILVAHPDHPDAWHLLGVIASRQRQHDIAVGYISQAIALKGTEAVFQSNLGAVFKDLGRLDEAVACCRRALELKPEYVKAYY